MRGRRQNARAEAEAQPRLPVPAYKPRMRPAGPQLNPSSSWLGAATSLRQEEAPASGTGASASPAAPRPSARRGWPRHRGRRCFDAAPANARSRRFASPPSSPPPRAAACASPRQPRPTAADPQRPQPTDAVTAVLTAQGLQRHHLRVCCACVDCLQPSPHDQVTQRHRSPARDLGKHPNPEVVDEGAVELEELLDELPVQVERDDVSALRHHDAAEEVGKVGADGLWPSRALLAQELPERKGHVGVVVVQDHEDVALLPLVRMSTEPLKSAQEFCARAKVLLH
eukprot:CAMPEP_0171279986 /NCGR_PEP_ID=MMETSP0790-20130122/65665_1 /TAXON_ID=2925 /ORGANISM="Alexandrium catenella, Strain OF101" /LENGTH=283 /DNA_ID=CAMNT_0011749187 /DNA_START=12 /DNA_END=863 /DNA_ORIENTATION=-